jgi:hypothetical protein
LTKRVEGVEPKITYYIRDASGNVMMVYEAIESNDASFVYRDLFQKEAHLYGSSRLGIKKYDRVIAKVQIPNGVVSYTIEPFKYRRERGQTYYELSNHLGNVLVTVTDMKVGIEGGTAWVAEYYEATVVSANDYYAFGSAMAGRKYNQGTYRFGFNLPARAAGGWQGRRQRMGQSNDTGLWF